MYHVYNSSLLQMLGILCNILHCDEIKDEKIQLHCDK